MWYLKNIRLVNFMGYRDVSFSFLDANNKPKKVYLIFAPNGCGKTSLLNAINLVYNSPRLKGRPLLGKYVYNEDYDPVYHGTAVKEAVAFSNKVKIEATLWNTDTNSEGTVILNNNGTVETCLEEAGGGYYIDADNPMHSNKFQIAGDYAKQFLDLAEIIYNFPCSFRENNKEVKALSKALWRHDKQMSAALDLDFHNDFIINKYGVKVHYKTFSGGEKKIATMLSQICDPNYITNASAVIIDSFEKEIYFKRQSRTVDKLVEDFSDKQFFIVTHSETLIKHVKQKYGEECLYDIEQYKLKDLGITSYNN